MANVKNIANYIFGCGSLSQLGVLLDVRRESASRDGQQDAAVILVDEYFERNRGVFAKLELRSGDIVRFIGTTHEATTNGVDQLMQELRSAECKAPCAVVGIGGGITLDTAKAVANLLTNPGPAAMYQGWDLVKNPAIYKVGVPTISGTGAESSRTCVMTNSDTGLKLGMNSDHTLYDQLVLDPELPATVPRNQYFYTGMDAYIHCIESLSGCFRNPVGDALSDEVLRLCRRVFLDGDMMSAVNRERLMTASYLGGCALATSFVGVVHPMSAGLSVVLGIHHCLANCITLMALDEFYPDACREFRTMVDAQGVEVPKAVCAEATEDQLNRMCAAASLHEKPLTNALGPDFRDALPPARMKDLFRKM